MGITLILLLALGAAFLVIVVLVVVIAMKYGSLPAKDDVQRDYDER